MFFLLLEHSTFRLTVTEGWRWLGNEIFCLLLVIYLCFHRRKGDKKYLKCAYVIYGWPHSHFARPYKTWPISWFKSQNFRPSCKVNSQQTYNIKKSKVVEKSQKESKKMPKKSHFAQRRPIFLIQKQRF